MFKTLSSLTETINSASSSDSLSLPGLTKTSVPLTPILTLADGPRNGRDESINAIDAEFTANSSGSLIPS